LLCSIKPLVKKVVELESSQLSWQRGIPDEATILTFRHILEKHELGEEIFETVKVHLHARGMQCERARSLNPP